MRSKPWAPLHRRLSLHEGGSEYRYYRPSCVSPNEGDPLFGKTLTGSNGTFWLPEDYENRCSGRLQASAADVSLEVVGDLTSYQFVHTGFGEYTEADDHPGPMLIHGQISDEPGAVTLMGMSTVRRQQIDFFGAASQALEGSYCLLGAHIPASDTAFSSVRIRFDCLEHWADMGGFTVLKDRGTPNMVTTYDQPDVVSEHVPDPSGKLSLKRVLLHPRITGGDVLLRSATWLEWEPKDPRTLADILRDFVLPVKHLFAILYGVECFIEELDLRRPGDPKWIGVVGDGIQPGRRTKTNPCLLRRKDASLGLIGNWLRISRDISPIPQILGGLLAGKTHYPELQALELCTAAEGLHRRLYRGKRRISEEDVSLALSVLDDPGLAIPDTVRPVLRGAMQYLWEPSFPQRMEALAERVSRTAPHIIGRINKWKSAVTDLRVANAHSIEGKRQVSGSELETQVISQSLMWLLAVTLLLEAGVTDREMRDALASSKRYLGFITTSRQLKPSVYSATGPLMYSDGIPSASAA